MGPHIGCTIFVLPATNLRAPRSPFATSTGSRRVKSPQRSATPISRVRVKALREMVMDRRPETDQFGLGIAIGRYEAPGRAQTGRIPYAAWPLEPEHPGTIKELRHIDAIKGEKGLAHARRED